jgi:hypothetical protein
MLATTTLVTKKLWQPKTISITIGCMGIETSLILITFILALGNFIRALT